MAATTSYRCALRKIKNLSFKVKTEKMPRIYCTKKLEGFIGNVEQDLPSDIIHRSLMDWNAHLFFVERKKCIVFVNNLTAYSVFIIDILKKDLKNIDVLFYSRLIEQLKHDKIIGKDGSYESLFPLEEMKFIKTNNDRKIIGRINDSVEMFKSHLFHKYDQLKNMNVIHENGLFNTSLTGKPGEIKKSWRSPVDILKNEK